MKRHLAIAMSLAAFASAAGAQVTTEFTYQGELRSGSALATGLHDFRVSLFTEGGTQLGSSLCFDNVDVVGGRFVLDLDFGVLDADSLKVLEIEVRADTGLACLNRVGFVAMVPRQPLTSSPYAITAREASHANQANFAGNATNLGGNPASFYLNRVNHTGVLPASGLSGSYANAVSLTSASNVLAGSGAGITSLNVGNAASGTLLPARGGTGTSVTSATTGHVLKWNGTAFTPQPDSEAGYNIGQGLLLVGNNLSVSSIGSALLAFDNNSLARVSGNAMSASGGNVTANNNLTVGNNLATGTISIDPVTRHMTVPGCAFQVVSGVGVDFDLDGQISSGTSVSTAVAPVTLPNGVSVTGIQAYIIDNDITGNASVFLIRRHTLDANPGGTMCSVTTSGTTNGIQAFTDATVSAPVVDNVNYSYFLRVDLPSDATQVLGVYLRAVRISYTVTNPVP